MRQPTGDGDCPSRPRRRGGNYAINTITFETRIKMNENLELKYPARETRVMHSSQHLLIDIPRDSTRIRPRASTRTRTHTRTSTRTSTREHAHEHTRDFIYLNFNYLFLFKKIKFKKWMDKSRGSGRSGNFAACFTLKEI